MEVTVKVAKETYELGQGLATFATKLKEALADGWQIGQDLPPILNSALTDLVPAVQGTTEIPAELEADKEAFMNGVVLGLAGIIKNFIK